MKKKKIALLGVMLVATACFAGCTKQATTNGSNKGGESVKTDNTEKINNIYVESEFAPLKRVVLTQSEIAFGDIDLEALEKMATKQSDSGSSLNVSEEDLDIYNMDYEELMKEWNEERNNLEKVLNKYGVEVQKPRLLTEKEKELGKVENGVTDGTGVTNFFARDPFFTIGNHIIEGSFKSLWRRMEVLPIRDILSNEAEQNDCYYVAVPQPDISEGLDSEKGPFLEGGDVLVYGKTVFVGNSGQASNEAGIKWLRNYLSHSGYNVVEVKLDKGILHLDCALSLVKEGLMIVCEDALPNGLPEELKSWDKIVVSYEDAERLATNGLPINEKVYVTDIAFKDTVGKELENRGITVEYIDYKISRSMGGAFRCSTQPLLRENDSK